MPNNTLSRADLSSDGEILNIHYGDVLIKYGDVLDCNSAEIPFVTAPENLGSKTRFLRDGDIVIADTAEDEAVGKTTELRGIETKKVVAGLHTIPCRPLEKFTEGYLGYYTNAPAFHDQLYSLMQGIKVLSISKSNISRTKIRFPVFDEQKKISDILLLLDKRIDAQRRLVEILKSYKRGLLEAIFMKKISNGFLRNEKWEKVCVGDILEVKHGRDYKDQPSDIGLHPVVGTGGQICKIDTYLCDWPCVCIGRKGTIDRPQYFDTPFWSVDTLFYTKPKAENNPRFQYYLFETIPWATYNEASSVPSLSASTIEQIPVEIPSKVTQDNLARFLSAVDAKIEISNCLLAKLIQAKQSLLQQIFI